MSETKTSVHYAFTFQEDAKAPVYIEWSRFKANAEANRKVRAGWGQRVSKVTKITLPAPDRR